MNTLLAIAVLVLWVLVIALVVVVFALARQIGVLYERVAPAGALMVNQKLAVGDAAPKVAIQALNGTQLVTGTGDKRQLLFFLTPDCPICKSLLPIVKTLSQQEDDTTMIFLSDGGREAEHLAYIEANELDGFVYALSEAAGRSFGVGKLPYAVLINKSGMVASLGIVNSREHLESLFESDRLGVASIQEYLDDRGQGEAQIFEPKDFVKSGGKL
jgi:methylamine dehydrogenase accessory protein MauD